MRLPRPPSLKYLFFTPRGPMLFAASMRDALLIMPSLFQCSERTIAKDGFMSEDVEGFLNLPNGIDKMLFNTFFAFTDLVYLKVWQMSF